MSSALADGFRALSSGVGLVLDAPRRLLRVTGTDRVSFLQGMLTADVVRLAPGASAPALFLTVQGRIVAVLDVIAEPDQILLDVATEQAEALRQGLESFVVADDVEIESVEARAALLAGPAAAAALVRAFGTSLAELGENTHLKLEPGDASSLLVLRDGDMAAARFRLWGKVEALRELSETLCAAGALLVGAEALEVARIFAGNPRAGVDFDETTLAPEVPALAQAISKTKGCYLGQEVVERVASRGRVQWLVVALRLDQPCVAGAEVFVDEERVGALTSVAVSPEDGSVAALGRLRRTAVDGVAALNLAGGGRARLVEQGA